MNDGEIVPVRNTSGHLRWANQPLLLQPFIGESNILPGTMIEDYLVQFNGKRFEAVDGGSEANEPVEVVIRPEDFADYPSRRRKTPS